MHLIWPFGDGTMMLRIENNSALSREKSLKIPDNREMVAFFIAILR